MNRGRKQWYKLNMVQMGEYGRKDLPRAISVDELQMMVGASQAFCSWDATNSTVSEEMDRWPFLFSHALTRESKVSTQ
ncbi:MAG: hypothetical protein ABSA32_12915 [Candidatus Acidiferrales bacterium]